MRFPLSPLCHLLPVLVLPVLVLPVLVLLVLPCWC
jgi:hypothetical protein